MDNCSGIKNKKHNGLGIVIHAAYKYRSPNKQKHWDIQEQLLSTEAVMHILLLKN